jgi:hypothetical protein
MTFKILNGKLLKKEINCKYISIPSIRRFLVNLEQTFEKKDENSIQ